MPDGHFRILVVYDWLEDFKIAKCPEFLIALISDSGVKPNKVTFHVSGKERRRTIGKKQKLLNIISPFTDYDWVALDETTKNNFLLLQSHLSWSSGFVKTYQVARPPGAFQLKDCVRHLTLACQEVTPRYGFTYIGRGAEAIFYAGGISSPTYNLQKTKQVSDLGRSLNRTKEHLSGYLHDVYELNVLSPLHLSCPVFGRTLASWIEEGRRGQLVRIKDEVHVWLVPDDVRPAVRLQLFEEGVLIASV
ncbi:hypothetical protein BH10PSE7_BH10PSE7_44980 [soil metagenome]